VTDREVVAGPVLLVNLVLCAFLSSPSSECAHARPLLFRAKHL
jgi:hypothetical protein